MEIEELIKKANFGDADAAYELSQHFYKESGEDIDDQRYQMWLATAAKLGNAKAVNELKDSDLIDSFEEMHVTLANYLFDRFVTKGKWPDCFTEHLENRADNTRDGKIAYMVAEYYHNYSFEDEDFWHAKALLWGHDHGYLTVDLLNIKNLLDNYEFSELIHDEFMRHNKIAEEIVDYYWDDEDDVEDWHEERGDKLPEKEIKPKKEKKKGKKKKLSFFDKAGITLKKIFKS